MIIAWKGNIAIDPKEAHPINVSYLEISNTINTKYLINEQVFNSHVEN